MSTMSRGARILKMLADNDKREDKKTETHPILDLCKGKSLEYFEVRLLI